MFHNTHETNFTKQKKKPHKNVLCNIIVFLSKHGMKFPIFLKNFFIFSTNHLQSFVLTDTQINELVFWETGTTIKDFPTNHKS